MLVGLLDGLLDGLLVGLSVTQNVPWFVLVSANGSKPEPSGVPMRAEAARWMLAEPNPRAPASPNCTVAGGSSTRRAWLAVLRSLTASEGETCPSRSESAKKVISPLDSSPSVHWSAVTEQTSPLSSPLAQMLVSVVVTWSSAPSGSVITGSPRAPARASRSASDCRSFCLR